MKMTDRRSVRKATDTQQRQAAVSNPSDGAVQCGLNDDGADQHRDVTPLAVYVLLKRLRNGSHRPPHH